MFDGRLYSFDALDARFETSPRRPGDTEPIVSEYLRAWRRAVNELAISNRVARAVQAYR